MSEIDTSEGISAAQGIMHPRMMQRRSPVFAIYESELEMLSVFNAVSSTAFALSASSLAFALGLWVDHSMEPAETPLGEAIVGLGVPAALVIALVCALVGAFALRKRGSTLDKIRTESREIASYSSGS